VVTLVDRLTHCAEVVQVNAPSYRLREAELRAQRRPWCERGAARASDGGRGSWRNAAVLRKRQHYIAAGRRLPSLPVLAQIAERLGVDLLDIVAELAAQERAAAVEALRVLESASEPAPQRVR